MGKHWWPAPEAGEIVWCHFPENKGINPGPKPRPALIVKVFDDQAPHFIVLVAYGTSQKTDQLRSGEFLIADHEAAAYQVAIVTPFVQVGRVPLKIQFSKPDKARAKNCAAAYGLYARSNFL